MKRVILVLALLTCAPGAFAQGVPPIKWELRFYLPGAAVPLATQTFLVADVTCNLDPASPSVPGSARWTDPFNVATVRDCQWVDPGTGVIRSRPLGVSYEVALVPIANDVDGPGPASARVSFRLPAFPARPGNVRVIP